MANSKRHKLVCCLMAMALLLSFFYVVPDPAGKAERGNAAACVADGQAAPSDICNYFSSSYHIAHQGANRFW